MLLLHLLVLSTLAASCCSFLLLQRQPVSSRRSLSSTTNDNDVKSLLVWDCDGVLVDSEALLKQGEVEALAEGGFSLTVDDCVRLFSGVSPDKATENFIAEFGKAMPKDFFKDQIEGSMDLFRKRLTPLM